MQIKRIIAKEFTHYGSTPKLTFLTWYQMAGVVAMDKGAWWGPGAVMTLLPSMHCSSCPTLIFNFAKKQTTPKSWIHTFRNITNNRVAFLAIDIF